MALLTENMSPPPDIPKTVSHHRQFMLAVPGSLGICIEVLLITAFPRLLTARAAPHDTIHAVNLKASTKELRRFSLREKHLMEPACDDWSNPSSIYSTQTETHKVHAGEAYHTQRLAFVASGTRRWVKLCAKIETLSRNSSYNHSVVARAERTPHCYRPGIYQTPNGSIWLRDRHTGCQVRRSRKHAGCRPTPAFI